MIRLARLRSAGVLDGALPAGATAYVDADWIPPDEADVPALVVETAGTEDSELRVAAAFRRVALEASKAVPPEDRPACEVPGCGLVAEWTRQALDAGDRHPDGRPSAIVETRSDPASIVGSSARLADLGTLVLAGDGAPGAFSLDMYPDIHVRGLHLVGVAPIDVQADVSELEADALDAFLELVTDVRLGEPLPSGARCYRVLPPSPS